MKAVYDVSLMEVGVKLATPFMNWGHLIYNVLFVAKLIFRYSRTVHFTSKQFSRNTDPAVYK